MPIKVEITSNVIEMEPGASQEVTLTITNQSNILDEFTITYQPISTPETLPMDGRWVAVEPMVFSLRPPAPGARTIAAETQQQVKITITVPPGVEANTYTGQFMIHANSGIDNSSEMPFRVVVAELEKHNLELVPADRISSKGTEVYKVLLTNNSNAAHIYPLYSEEPENLCKIELIPPEVHLGPSEQRAITLRVKPKKRNWASPDKKYNFIIRADGYNVEADGSFLQRCAIPPAKWAKRHGKWLILGFLGLLLAIVAIIFIWLPMLIIPSPQVTACAPTTTRNFQVTSNSFETSIYVDGAFEGSESVRVATISADQMPGIFANLVSVSPDGRRLAYVTAQNLALERAVLNVYSIDEKKLLASTPISLEVGLFWPTAPMWSADGDKLVFLVRPPTVSTSGTALPTVAAPTATISNSSVITTASVGASNATNAAVTQATLDPKRLDLWIWEIAPIKKIRKLSQRTIGNITVDRFYGTKALERPVCWNYDNQHVIVKALPQPEFTGQNGQDKFLWKYNSYNRMYSIVDGTEKILGPTPFPWENYTPQLPAFTVGVNTPNAPQAPQIPGGPQLPSGPRVGAAPSGAEAPGRIGQMSLNLKQPIASQVTTATDAATVAGNCVLNNIFSQNDPRWYNASLRSDNVPGRIGDAGCAIVATSMLLNSIGFENSPADLSSCLDRERGNLSNPLDQRGWRAMGEQCGNFKLQNGQRTDFSWSQLNSNLAQGPAIVGMLGGPTGVHFVIVTGGVDSDATTYTVVDPWDGTSYKTLQNFVDWGYNLRWMVNYNVGSGQCGVAADIASKRASWKMSILADGPEDGGLYREPQQLRAQLINPTDDAVMTINSLQTGANASPGDYKQVPFPADDVARFNDDGRYEVLVEATGTISNNKVSIVHAVNFVIDRTPAEIISPTFSPVPINPNELRYKNAPVTMEFRALDKLSGIASIQYLITNEKGESTGWRTYTSDSALSPVIFGLPGTYVIIYRAINGVGISTPELRTILIIEAPAVASGNTTTTGGGRGQGGQVVGQPTVNRPANSGAGGGTGPANNGGASSGLGPSGSTPNVAPTATPGRATPRPTVAPFVPNPNQTTAAPSPQGTSLLPASRTPAPTSAITPTATSIPETPTPTTIPATLEPTPTLVVTPTATAVAAAQLQVAPSQIIFDVNSLEQQLRVENTGGLAVGWSLFLDAASPYLTATLTSGSLNGQESVGITLRLLVDALPERDIVEQVRVLGSNGSSFTIPVQIVTRAKPTAVFLSPLANSGIPASTNIALKINAPTAGRVPEYAILTGTYQTSVNVPQAIFRLSVTPDASNNWSVLWNTLNFPPQKDMRLTGALCSNKTNPICTEIPEIGGLEVFLQASFDQSVVTTPLNSLTTNNATVKLNIPFPDVNRAATSTLEIKNEGVVLNSGTDASKKWELVWDTNQAYPTTEGFSRAITYTGNVCDVNNNCRAIDNSLILETRLLANITFKNALTGAVVDFNTDKFIPTKLLVSAAPNPSSNVSSLELHVFANQKLPNPILVLNSSNGWQAIWDNEVTGLPPQKGVELFVMGNYFKNVSGGLQVIEAMTPLYNGLIISALPPASIQPVNTYIINANITDTNVPAVLTDTFRARVRDAKGNASVGVSVTFTVSSVPTKAGGVFNQVLPSGNQTETRTGTTDASGIVTSPLAYANNRDGFWIATATVGGVITPANFTVQNSNLNNPPLIVVPSSDNMFAQVTNVFTGPLQVKAMQGGNGVDNVAVTFVVNPVAGASGHFINNTNFHDATTNAQGLATTPQFVAGLKVGTYRVTVSAQGYQPAIINLTNLTGPPAEIQAVNSVATISAPILTKFGITPDFRVVDVGSNPVGNVAVRIQAPNGTVSGTFSISATMPGASRIYTATTDASGIAKAADFYAGTKVSTPLLSPTPYSFVANLVNTPAISLTAYSFVNKPGLPTEFVITPTVTTVAVVSKTLSTDLQVQVLDAGKNAIPNQSVRFNIPSAADGGFQPGGAISRIFSTGSSGEPAVLVAATDYRAGCSPTVYDMGISIVTTTVMAGPTGFKIQNLADVPYTLTTSSTPVLNQEINQVFAPNMRVSVTDQCGNGLPGYGVAFNAPVAGASGGFAPSNSQTFNVNTNFGGLATASAFQANAVAGAYSVTTQLVTATVAVNNGAFALTNNTAPASQITLTQNPVPASLVVSNTLTPNLASMSVRIRDYANNPVAGTSVVFTITAAGGSTALFTSNNQATSAVASNANGEVIVPAFKANTVAHGNYTIRAGVIGQTPEVTFSVTNLADVPANLTALAPNTSVPVTLTVGGTRSNFQVRIDDQYGNYVPNELVTFTIDDGSKAYYGTVSNQSTTATSSGLGVVSMPTITASPFAGNYNVGIVTTAGPYSESFGFRNLPDKAVTLTSNITTSPTMPFTATVDIPNSFTTTNILITALDQFNNPVPNTTIAYTVTQSITNTASGYFVGFGANTTNTTNAAGQVNAPQVTVSTTHKTGDYLLNASLQSAPTNVLSYNMRNVAGNPTTINLSQTAMTTTVNTAFPSLTATLFDQYANVVPGRNVSFNGPLAGASTNPATTNIVSNGSGQAQVTLNANTIAGTYNLTVSSPGATNATVNMTNQVGGPVSITPNQLSGNGAPISTTVNTNFPAFTVTVRDIFNNPVSNVQVRYRVIPAGAVGATFQPSTGVTLLDNTDAVGVATSAAETLRASTSAGNYTMDVELVSNPLTKTTFFLRNNAGAPNSIAVAPAGPYVATVNTNFTPLTFTVEDVFNNPVPTTTVTINDSVLAGANITTATVNIVTNLSGQASTTLRANTVSGSYSVTAQAGAANMSLAMTNNAGAAANILLSTPNSPAAPFVTAAGGTFATGSTTISVTDSFGNVLPSQTITFTTPAGPTGANLASVPPNIVTDGAGQGSLLNYGANNTSGVFTTTVRSTTASRFIHFQSNPGPAATVAVTSGNNQTQLANGTFTNALTVTVRDSNNNLVANGTAVTFTAPGSGASATMGGSNVFNTTTTNGVATATAIANSTLGTYNIVVTSGAATSASFTLTNTANMAIITGSGGKFTLLNGGTVTGNFQVRVTGSGGTAVPGATVEFSVAAAAGTLGGLQLLPQTTDGFGDATVDNTLPAERYVAGATLGTHNITATLKAGATPIRTSIFTVTNGVQLTAISPTTFALPKNVNDIPGMADKIAINVTDAANNPVNGVAITYSLPNTTNGRWWQGGALTSAPATSNASGLARYQDAGGGSYDYDTRNTTATYTLTAATTIAGLATSVVFTINQS